jgi:hypothetical protein
VGAGRAAPTGGGEAQRLERGVSVGTSSVSSDSVCVGARRWRSIRRRRRLRADALRVPGGAARREHLRRHGRRRRSRRSRRNRRRSRRSRRRGQRARGAPPQRRGLSSPALRATELARCPHAPRGLFHELVRRCLAALANARRRRTDASARVCVTSGADRRLLAAPRRRRRRVEEAHVVK